MDSDGILTRRAVQLYSKLSNSNDEDYTTQFDGVQILPEMPEPRCYHGAVCLDRSESAQDGQLQHMSCVVVAGGFNQGRELVQTVYMLKIQHDYLGSKHRINASWSTLPSMDGAETLHPTLMAVKNRYIYQVSGFHDECNMIARLDIDAINADGAAWERFEIYRELSILPSIFPSADVDEPANFV